MKGCAGWFSRTSTSGNAHTSGNAEATPSPTTQETPVHGEVLDVVIVGAGWAGLGAARYLYDQHRRRDKLDHGSFQFCILEGASHLGGRSHTVQGPSSSSDLLFQGDFELGSQWIHGVHKNNVVYQLALQHDMMIHYDRGQEDWRNGLAAIFVDTEEKEDDKDDNQQQPTTITQRCQQNQKEQEMRLLRGKHGFYPFLYKYPNVHKKQWRKQQQHGRKHAKQNPPPPISVHDVYQIYCHQKNLSPEDQRYLHYLLDMDLTQDYAASIQDIDGTFWDHDLEYSGGDSHFGYGRDTVDRGTLAGGYSALIHKYMEPLLLQPHISIRCNCVVTSIDYSNDPVVIEYQKQSQSEQQQSTTHRILAHTVLCTVPLGVLKSNTIEFTPKLPPPKQEAIQKLGVGTYNKVILMWNPQQREQLPWLFPIDQPKQQQQSTNDETGKQTRYIWMTRINAPNQEQGPWTCCYTAQTHQGHDRPILLYFFLAGRQAPEIETMNDQETQQAAMTALREWFDDPHIPDPQHVMVTRWHQDPLAKGSYSYYHVGSGPQDRRELAKPDAHNRLFFAGEACHVEYFATTHGALMTGQSSGKLLWKAYMKRHKKEKKDMKQRLRNGF